MSEEDIYEQCPYNKGHIILKSRMMYHTVKCKKTLRPVQYLMPMGEYENFNYAFSSNKQEEKYTRRNLTDKDMKLFNVPIPEPKENWDNINIGFSYDPNLKIQSEPLLRCLCAASKRERRDFRENERRRFYLFEMRNGHSSSENNHLQTETWDDENCDNTSSSNSISYA